MLAAALVPDTVLLLRGTAGRGALDPALGALRTAAAAVVADAVARAERVVVVAPGRADRAVVGDVPLGAAAAGVPDHLLHDAVPTVRLAAPRPGPDAITGAPGSGAVVGLRLALDAGAPAERLHAVEVAPGPVPALRALGAALCATGPGGASTALVVVGSGSARHGDDAPLPGDPRAADGDAALLAALHGGSARARAALAGLDADTAAALAVTGWAPWQVLVGALDAAPGAAPDPEVRHAAAWRGAAHAAVLWRVAA